MSSVASKPEEAATEPSARPLRPNVIVLNEEGLDDASLARVLSPFSNSRRFVGISVAAEAERRNERDSLLEQELAVFARASAAHD